MERAASSSSALGALPHPRRGARAKPPDRVMAEALRITEERQGRPFEDSAVVAAVIRDCEGRDLRARVIERARRLAPQQGLDEAVTRASAGYRLAALAGLVAALVLGAAAARAALRDGTASVAGLLFGLLGVQSVMLILWIAWIPLRARLGEGAILGRAIVALGRFFSRHLGPVRERSRTAAAVTAIGIVHARGGCGLWTFSALSHGLWSAFNAGALIVLAALFLGEGYQFRWDSTWLSAETYRSLIESVAAGPALLGFLVPDAAQIDASRAPRGLLIIDSQDVATREAWSWLFFGAILVYGLLPRAALLFLSLAFRARALSRGSLDLSRPGFAVLRARLLPDAAVGPAHAQSSDIGPFRDEATLADTRPPGAPAIVALELSNSALRWPPPVDSSVGDLGVIDGRDDVQRVIRGLTSAPASPNPLFIVVEARRSPDRGIERLVGDVRRAAGGNVCLLVTGGRAVAQSSPPDAAARRSQDWMNLAARVGIAPDRAVEIDLEHLTDVTRARLSEIVRGSVPGAGSGAPPRRLEEAFARIEHAALHWSDSPTDREIASLYSEISQMYGHESRSWGRRFATQLAESVRKGGLSMDAAIPALRSAGDSIRSLLPASLTTTGKWIGAGALAGAIGCIAVAVTITPAAAAALPAWSLLGAAISAAASLARSAASHSEAHEPSSDLRMWDDAVRSATLFALVLELQGRPEERITRILARALPSDSEDRVSAATLGRWLADIRFRAERAIIDEDATR